MSDEEKNNDEIQDNEPQDLDKDVVEELEVDERPTEIVVENKNATDEVYDPLVGRLKPRDLVIELETSYLDYAMSVIVSRALPDVRDGLKPVHRRVLYGMYETGLRHNVKYRKSAKVVG